MRVEGARCQADLVTARAGGEAVLRAAFALLGSSAVAFGLLAGPAFLAAHLSPDGQITELGYVVALRAIAVAGGAAALLLGLRARVGMLQNCALLVATLGVMAVGLEGALDLAERLAGGGGYRPTGLRASTVPGLVYENTPGFQEDGERKFNSLGMRDEERAFEAHTAKIVVVGDSIEAWRALPVTGMYPRLLESMLNTGAPATEVQVVNLGVTGYSFRQKVLMLRHRGLAWHPRLAIVGYCLNDPIPAGELVSFFTGRAPARGWRSVEFVNRRVRDLLHRYGVDFYGGIHDPGGASWRALAADFGRLGRLSREAGVPVVLVIFPLMADTTVDYPWRGIHDRVVDLARRNRIVAIDLLARYGAAGFARVREDGVHPGALGHRIAAEALHAVIVEQGLVGREAGAGAGS